MDTFQAGASCVLIPGFNFSARDWHEVMVGKFIPGGDGRILTGLKKALLTKARLVYWGGGAQAEATLARVRKHEGGFVRYLGTDVSRFLHQDYFVGTNGTNTVAEVSDALLVCNKRKLTELIIASDEGHLLRCLKYAIEQTRQLNMQHIKIGFAQSDTSCTTRPTLVFEAPTTYQPNLYEVARRLLELNYKLGGDIVKAEAELLALIDRLIEEEEGAVRAPVPHRQLHAVG